MDRVTASHSAGASAPELGREVRPRTRRAALLVVAAVVASLLVPRALADSISDAGGDVLGREPLPSVEDLGADLLDGLQLPDPSDGLSLIEPPEANSQGSAQLAYPLLIPRGRADLQPDLTLTYDSSGGSSWTGLGWDLSLGEVSVDTRWGVPRYLPDQESETYLLDGEVLSPTAVRSEFEPRVAERDDFTRRVEGEFERVIRHGDGPGTYWWEVTDKMGTVRYYGGTPEGERDSSAILTDEAGHGFRWGLTAVVDISSNIMRISYAKPGGERVGADGEGRGQQLYLREITYTGSILDGNEDDPAYLVRFLRDDDISPAPEPRPDVTIDGTGGFLQVTSDLLRRVEVYYGTPPPPPPEEPSDPPASTARSFDHLVTAYDLRYEVGAYQKTLLVGVDQIGSDGEVYGSHDFTYHDDVRDTEGRYEGFDADPETWDTGSDIPDLPLLDQAIPSSALGTSLTVGADVHAYLGFNPLKPGKATSFGGALTVNAGVTEGLAELTDLNGDQLPDKVFRLVPGGPVMYRLNQSGPDGGTTFGDAQPVDSLGSLSSEYSVGFSGAIEGHFVATAQFSIGGELSFGDEYFADVNSDGLPDFVSGGSVLFNRLVDGEPRFLGTSEGTAVPVDDGSLEIPDLEVLQELEELQRSQSPLSDTVRRWIAPYDGQISVFGPPRLDPTVDPEGAAYDGDGVRVAIQHGPTELWSQVLTEPDEVAALDAVDAIEVARGDAIYFRVGSIDDGARDQVRWNPRIVYTSLPVDTPTDVNGLDQRTFRAADEFTPAGRPGATVGMPLDGTVRFEASLTKSAPTTDDLVVLVLHEGEPVVSHHVPQDFVGSIDVSEDFAVSGPDDEGEAEQVEVRIQVDSPVDVTTLSFSPSLRYLEAFDSEGQPVLTEGPDGEPTLQLLVPYDIDIYPTTTSEGPVTASFVGDGAERSIDAVVRALPGAVGATVALTVKSREEGLVAKDVFVVEPGGAVDLFCIPPPPPLEPLFWCGTGEVTAFFEEGVEYFVDLSIRSPDLSERFVNATVDEEHTVNLAGRQNIFPLAYRGWAYAGYRAEGARATTALVESDFVFDPEGYPDDCDDEDDCKPDDFEDDGFKSPRDEGAYPYIATVIDVAGTDGDAVSTTVWRGYRDALVGGAAFARSSRESVERVSIDPTPGGGAGARAPMMIGLAAPSLALTAGIVGATLSLGLGPSIGIADFTDINGDGFPDVLFPENAQVTGPRGGFLDSTDGLPYDGTPVVNTDSAFAISAGFGGSPVAIKGSASGDTGTAQNTSKTSGNSPKQPSSGSASTGESASGDEYGASLGASADIGVSVSNPAPGDASFSTVAGELGDHLLPGPMEQDLADMNGDGLPDRVYVDRGQVHVQLNLGYRFDDPLVWANGGFENSESYNGSVGVTASFEMNNKEFSGGLSLNESIDMARYSWIDIDGDGVLDRLFKPATGDIEVAFGSGAGLHDDLDYGPFAEGVFELIGEIPIGEQVAMGRSRGLGAGADFTISIGPLCTVACYLIVNPGVHAQTSLSADQVQLVDIDGDGYPDSVSSGSDDEILVRRNRRGRTNLLAGVGNPLGGHISLDYARKGNTVDQPYSQWVMSEVVVDDGRPGDGADTRRSSFEYEGNRYDALERETYGYATVVEHQHDTTADGSPILRSYRRTYANGNVFEAGQQTSETLLDGDGNAVLGTEMTIDVLAVGSTDPLPLDVAPPVARLEMAGAPLQTAVTHRWFDGSGATAQETRTEYSYDGRGNVTEIIELGELEVSTDDTRAVITYPDCPESGVSAPATFTVFDHAGQMLRHRDGSLDLCENSVPIELKETIGDGREAISSFTFDDYGNYDSIEYPPNEDGERLLVEYVYDDDRVTDIASVVDSHDLTAELTYDGPTGNVTSRTDANGQTTSYTYDALGRVETVTGPYEQGTGHPTITYSYAPTDDGYAHATASHFDAFDPDDPIVTVAFVDGTGRLTQTKQDGTVFRDQGSAPEDVMIVGGAISYDALGRAVAEWFPTTEPLGQATEYSYATSVPGPRTMSWTLTDRIAQVVAPGGATTTYQYGYGDGSAAGPSLGAQLFQTTVTDPAGKPRVSYTDVRDLVWAHDDAPVDAPAIRTRYGWDGLGQLVSVTDPIGAVTSHTYDMLGQRTSTSTPDGGLTVFRHDPAGNVVELEDAVMRTVGQVIDYDYDHERLVAIRYPDGTPDVEYTYGGPGTDGNGAGRVVEQRDGARHQRLTYDPLGNVASETSTMLVHNLNDGTEARLTFTTSSTYEAFSRLVSLEYPDGEVLQHDYDSGGLLSSVTGTKGDRTYHYVDRLEYDEFSDRRFVAFGNGTATTVSYDPHTRRLDRIHTVTPEREVQDLHHSYDAVGNVTGIVNDLPAPHPSLMGGPSSQSFIYDPYHRLVGASGEYRFGSNKTRFYESTVAYDASLNLTAKHQVDEIQNGGSAKNRIVQKPTTYDLAPEYAGAGPHQVSRIGTRAYHYDLNGNGLGWTDDATGQRRTVTFDAEDRVTSVADQGSTTRYTYDAQNRLAIERGPGGETSFVNRWYTVRNGTVAWKHIFAGDLRVATKRVFAEGEEEHIRLFLHPDSLGSTNIVTDAQGLVFQHLEHFPSGEIWVHEKSDEHRTPYRYIGAYQDEVREILDLGERWYDPREQRLLSPDPLLYDDPDDVIEDPGLLAPYAYAQASPLTLVDPLGRQSVSSRASFTHSFGGTSYRFYVLGKNIEEKEDPKGSSSRFAPANPIPTSLHGPLGDLGDMLESAPLLEISFSEGEGGWGLKAVKVSPLIGGLQRTVIARDEGGDDKTDTGQGDSSGDPTPGAGGAAAAVPSGTDSLGASGGGAAAGGTADPPPTLDASGGAPVADSKAP